MPYRKARVRTEDDFSYRDKFNERTVRFVPKSDEVMATFEPVSEGDESEGLEASARTVMGATSLPVSRGINRERGFAVFGVAAESDVAAALASLDAQPQIVNTIPVMEDEEGLTRFLLPDELTVQFVEGVSPEQAETLLRNCGSTVLVRQRTPGYYTVSVPEGKGLFETIRTLAEMDEVAFAEPSEAGFDDALDYIPDDAHFGQLWGLHNTGQTIEGVAGTPDSDIDAPGAWDLERGDPDVIVAVIDTGADMDHPDLVANLLPRGSEDWDFADDSPTPGGMIPEDADGHGTHVAGTAAAVDNVSGVVGVAHGCRIMPLRINLIAGMNQNRADAINYVTAQAGAHPNRRYVINGSWKMSGNMTAVQSAIINAVSNNVVVVFAAGNQWGGPVTYPGKYPETIAVANTDNRDRLAASSAKGPEVDVCAPGSDVYSTYLAGGYAYLSGTSMASPHVAGLAALIWSRNKTLSNAEVRQIIESTCDNIDAQNPSHVGQIGQGRINAHRALLATALPVLFKLDRNFPFPQKNNGSSSGLAFARRLRVSSGLRPVLLFLTQQPYSEKIYFLNPADGSVLGDVDPQGNDTIGCLEWDGRIIRAANVTTGSGWINSIHPQTGAQVGQIRVPPGRGEGLTGDGRLLYYSTINRIHVIRASDGAVLRSFPPPGGPCRALAYAKGYLFSGNSTAGTITVFHATTLAIRGTFPAPGRGTAKVEGLAFDPSNNELFIANQSANTVYVGRVNL